MRAFRHFISDRLSGGVVAALVAYVVLVQGILGAYGQGAMAAANDGGLPFVICSSAGAIAADDAGSTAPAGKAGSHECCTALCHLACAFKIVVRNEIPGPVLRATVAVAEPATTGDAAGHATPCILLPGKRAPPISV